MRTWNLFWCTMLSVLAVIISFIEPVNSQPLASTFVSPSISNSCVQTCGRIHIPYPFGMGNKECFLSEWFEVICKSTNASNKGKTQTPFLSKINREVVKITLVSEIFHPSVHIKSPVISSGCSQQPQNPKLLNLIGDRSPFFITNENLFVSVGCESRALVTVDETHIFGCETKCDGRKNSHQEVKNKFCTGYKCCTARIPDEIERPQAINVSLETSGGNFTQGGSCNVAFLTSDEETYLRANVAKPEEFYANGFTVVELGWLFDTSDPRSIKPAGCFNFTKRGIITSSDHNYSCVCDYGYYSGFGYNTCQCNDGYSGNPYLPSGCIDVDECEEGIRGDRCRDMYCVNIPGSYKCEAIKAATRKLPRAIIGLIISFILLVLILGIWRLIKFIKKRWMIRSVKEQRKMILDKTFFKRDGNLLLRQHLTTEGGSNIATLKIFNSKELRKATDNFNENRIIGQGGQGTVYKGMLVDGSIVAVKRSKILDENKFEEFINEVGVLSGINHRNIVRLLGCCLEAKLPVLVYEYIQNGDLYKRLHDESDEGTISWDLRLRIAMESADALSYLHSSTFNPVYHKDVKTLNILLDGSYRAKLSDFGLSRSISIDQTHLTTHVVGTFGYLDPEWFQTGRFTDKSDVYSFGVVLVELITGEKPVSVSRPEPTRALAAYFIDVMKKKRLLELVDSRIRDECKTEQLLAMAKLARSCLNSKGKNRPTMRQVTMELERIRVSPHELELHTIIEEEEEEEGAVASTSMGISIDDDGGRGDTIEEIIPR